MMKPTVRWLLITACLLITTASQALSLTGNNGGFGGDLPSVDEAIQVSAEPDWEHHQLLTSFSLIDHVYLYKKRFEFTLLDDNGKVLQTFPNPILPGGQVKNDDLYGHVTVFYNHLDVTLPVTRLPDGASRLRVRYQGCIEDTLCYPPETRTFDVAAPHPAAASVASSKPKSAVPPSAAAGNESFVHTLFSEDANAFRDWMQNQNLALVLSLFFLGGILLAFTPCVFPMIPILSGIIAGERHPSARRGFVLSVAYVLGVAVPYTLAGLLVALFGAGLNLQFLLQQPAAIITSAVIFVLLALSMFGLYELQLPEKWRDRLNNTGPKKGGGLIGAAVLGAISALVVSPCVTPILAGALIYVAGSGNALTGALSLFALAMGMGVPLIVVGTGGGHLLPRAGLWMDEIKRFFGVVMLAVAIWLLGRIISEVLILALYGLLLAVYGLQLGALDAVAGGRSRFKRGLALVVTLYGVIMLVGAAAGGHDPWQPLAPFSARPAAEQADTTAAAAGTGASLADSTVRSDHSPWKTLNGGDALATALRQSAAAHRPVLLDFFAEWCVACKALEKNTLRKASVLQALNGFNLYRVDITQITPGNQKLMSDYQIFGLPALVFFDAAGNEIAHSRVLGEMGPGRFVGHLNNTVRPALAP